MRNLLWFFGVLILLSIIMFFINPSLFTQRGSMWTVYEEWNSTNLDTTTYDLYKPIGSREVELEDKPFLSFMQNGINIDLYKVESLKYQGSWPYNGLIDDRKDTIDEKDYYGAIATMENEIIAKNLLYINTDIVEYEQVTENTFSKEFGNGLLVISVFVADYDDMDEIANWTQETINFYKNWVFNDQDKEIKVTFTLEEKE